MTAAGVASLLALGCVAISACGSEAASVARTDLALPTRPPATLAAAELSTSPDGGIYVNHDPFDVVMLTTRDVSSLAARLGASRDWTALRDLGQFTLVGLRITNAGKAGSEPQLDDLQVASDFAPAAAAGSLRHFYHPTYPLAIVSAETIAGNCTVHLDPGQTVTLVLVYPPLRSTATILWGRYRQFALELAQGGALGPQPDSLHSSRCTPPVVAP
jgi:hypothetical protein